MQGWAASLHPAFLHPCTLHPCIPAACSGRAGQCWHPPCSLPAPQQPSQPPPSIHQHPRSLREGGAAAAPAEVQRQQLLLEGAARGCAQAEAGSGSAQTSLLQTFHGVILPLQPQLTPPASCCCLRWVLPVCEGLEGTPGKALGCQNTSSQCQAPARQLPPQGRKEMKRKSLSKAGWPPPQDQGVWPGCFPEKSRYPCVVACEGLEGTRCSHPDVLVAGCFQGCCGWHTWRKASPQGRSEQSTCCGKGN